MSSFHTSSAILDSPLQSPVGSESSFQTGDASLDDDTVQPQVIQTPEQQVHSIPVRALCTTPPVGHMYLQWRHQPPATASLLPIGSKTAAAQPSQTSYQSLMEPISENAGTTTTRRYVNHSRNDSIVQHTVPQAPYQRQEPALKGASRRTVTPAEALAAASGWRPPFVATIFKIFDAPHSELAQFFNDQQTALLLTMDETQRSIFFAYFRYCNEPHIIRTMLGDRKIPESIAFEVYNRACKTLRIWAESDSVAFNQSLREVQARVLWEVRTRMHEVYNTELWPMNVIHERYTGMRAQMAPSSIANLRP